MKRSPPSPWRKGRTRSSSNSEIAFSFSRTTKPDGSPARALTLGTKLTGGFGVVVTGLFAISAMNNHTTTTVNASLAEAEFCTEQDLLITAMESDILATRLLGFRATSQCRFEHVAAMEGEYRRHGRFVVEITMKGNSPEGPSHALQSIHQCLTAPRRPATE